MGRSFLAAGGQRLAGFSVRDGVLDAGIPDAQIVTSSGCGNICIDDHDAFIVVGNGFGVQRALKAFQKYRTLRYEQPKLSLVSSALFIEMIAYLLRATVATRIVEQIRNASDKPILVVPQPAPHTGIGRLPPAGDERQMTRYKEWKIMFESEVAGFLSEAFNAGARKAVGASVGFIRQPQVTFDGYLTDERFSAKSIGDITPGAVVKRPHASDVNHMNIDYGALILDAIELKLEV
ncbi:hypothetical protein GCM10010994_16440 [Chelatococcus reniformis]|uniref:Uncharacterized protein n=1 Tax=Chelatococcus reniformis TaxID=1494448 RepID=A0A916U2I8_9HYPH|nr:hypothetical protein GCM10010994_16440 [Chelatococcus reniformis]